MGVRLQGGYKKFTDTYDIYILDTAYASTIYEVNVSGEGFRLDYTPSEENRFAPIFTSTCTVNLAVDNSNGNLAAIESFISDLVGAEEGRFILEIDKNSSLWWIGAILPDLVTYDDRKDPYFFQVRATDGIGKLKDIEYNNSGTAYTGNATLAGHIFNCLDKIGVTSFHSDFIIDNTHWVEDDMQVHTVATGNITRLLDYSRLDHRLFKEQDRKGKITYRSCFYVLENIMKAIGGRLMYSDGAYRVDQYNKLDDDDIFYYKYDNTGTINTTPVRDTSFKKTIDTDNQRAVGSGATIGFFPALKKTVVFYDHFSTRNLIEGEVWDESSTSRTFDEFDTNGGTAKILFGWNVQYNVNFGGTDTPNFVLWRVRIKVGSYYLRRTATVRQNGIVDYGETQWSLSNSYYYFAGDPSTFDNLTQNKSITDVTPVPTTGGTLEVIFEEEAVYDLDGNIISALSYTLTFDAEGYIEALINGVIKDQTEERSYVSNNNTAGNTKREEIEVVIGDGPTGNSFGHLEIYNGSTWENSAAWRVGDSGTYTEIGALLANEVLAGALTPVKRMQGAITGDYEAHLPLVRNSERYIALRLSFTPKDRLWQGEWWDLQIGATLTEETPEERVRTRPIPISILSNGTTGETEAPEIVTSPGDVVLQDKFIPYKVDSAISSGATVTTITIDRTAADLGLLSGDVITLIDPTTGNSQDFTLTADVDSGDTTISVTSDTADFDFPVGTYIAYDEEDLIIKATNSIPNRWPSEAVTVNGGSGSLILNGGTGANSGNISILSNAVKLENDNTTTDTVNSKIQCVADYPEMIRTNSTDSVIDRIWCSSNQVILSHDNSSTSDFAEVRLGDNSLQIQYDDGGTGYNNDLLMDSNKTEIKYTRSGSLQTSLYSGNSVYMRYENLGTSAINDITVTSVSIELDLNGEKITIAGNAVTLNTTHIKTPNLSAYANHAAADSDSSLPQYGLYLLTGDRTVYRKP